MSDKKRKPTNKEASAWDDNDDWAFADESKVDRDLSSSPKFKPQSAKILAKCLRSTTIALGNAMSAYTKFTKLKSVKVSPDGQLGGSGYVQSVKDMRRQYSNVVEALSRLSDTLYDELHAPHWEKVQDKLKPKDRKDVKEILEDVDKIHKDPELWAEEEEIEEFGDTDDSVDLTPKEEKEIVEESFTKKASSLAELVNQLDQFDSEWGE
jgi:hypothetical protein